ncbi:MAG: hypothetical protein HY326_01640 [Chloroflexi bacterium]|nr:hypothetical protein [Chloroflexota bacterium]
MLDWKVDEEYWNEPPKKPVPPKKPRFSNWRPVLLGSLLALVVVILGVGAYLFWKNREANLALRQVLQESVDNENWALQKADVNLYSSLIDDHAPADWVSLEVKLFQNEIKDPPRAPQLKLMNVEFIDPDFSLATVEISTPNQGVWQEVRAYRRQNNDWKQTVPTLASWGSERTQGTACMELHYYQRDEDLVQGLAADLDNFCLQVRQDFGIGMPGDGELLRVIITPSPFISTQRSASARPSDGQQLVRVPLLNPDLMLGDYSFVWIPAQREVQLTSPYVQGTAPGQKPQDLLKEQIRQAATTVWLAEAGGGGANAAAINWRDPLIQGIVAWEMGGGNLSNAWRQRVASWTRAGRLVSFEDLRSRPTRSNVPQNYGLQRSDMGISLVEYLSQAFGREVLGRIGRLVGQTPRDGIVVALPQVLNARDFALERDWHLWVESRYGEGPQEARIYAVALHDLYTAEPIKHTPVLVIDQRISSTDNTIQFPAEVYDQVKDLPVPVMQLAGEDDLGQYTGKGRILQFGPIKYQGDGAIAIEVRDRVVGQQDVQLWTVTLWFYNGKWNGNPPPAS